MAQDFNAVPVDQFYTLAASFSRDPEQAGLAQKAVNLLIAMDWSKDEDGSLVMKGPAFMDSEKMHAYAGAVSQALYFMDIEPSHDDFAFDHTDVMKSIMNNSRPMGGDLKSLMNEATRVNEYDHLRVRITPDVLAKAQMDYNGHKGAMLSVKNQEYMDSVGLLLDKMKAVQDGQPVVSHAQQQPGRHY